MQEQLTIEEIQNFQGKYPKQIWPLFFSEMWERFSFYGMRGMLAFFMVNQLDFDKVTANLQYGATQAFVYAFTFVGGLLADKILGKRRSLFWGGILMIVGSILLAINPHDFFFLGIAFNIVGTGFFKPNISSMVGNLYKDGDSRIDAGFMLFYAGVNAGALFGGYLCIAIGKGEMLSTLIPEAMRWNIAFGISSVFMIISLLTFTQTQKTLGNIGLSPLLDKLPNQRMRLEMITFVGSIIAIPIIMAMVSKTEYTDYFMYSIGPIALLYLLIEMRNFTSSENKKIIAAVLFMLFSIVFWAFFEQSGGSLSFFAADNLNHNLLGFNLDPNGVNNASNSLFVIIFAAPLGLFWLFLNKRKAEPNTIVKFGLGFIFLAIGFYIFYFTKFLSDANGITSLNLFTFGWFIITFGELCLSPIGTSVMTKLSPPKTQAVIMGMWFLASAYGQYFAGILGADIAEASGEASNVEKLIVYADGYKQLGIYALIAGIIMIALSPLIKKLMQDVK